MAVAGLSGGGLRLFARAGGGGAGGVGCRSAADLAGLAGGCDCPWQRAQRLHLVACSLCMRTGRRRWPRSTRWRGPLPRHANGCWRHGLQGAAFCDTTARSGAATCRVPAILSRWVLLPQRAGLAAGPDRRVYLHGFAGNLVSAALRLVPLGQTDGQAVLAALAPLCAADRQDARMTHPATICQHRFPGRYRRDAARNPTTKDFPLMTNSNGPLARRDRRPCRRGQDHADRRACARAAPDTIRSG